MLASYKGSEREFDKVPNWRGFQDFEAPTEADGFGNCGLSAVNRPARCRSQTSCPAEMVLSPVWTTPGPCQKLFHSMKVEQAFPLRLRPPFEGFWTPGSHRSFGTGTFRHAVEHGAGSAWSNAGLPLYSGLPEQVGIPIKRPSALVPGRFSGIHLAAARIQGPGGLSDSRAEPLFVGGFLIYTVYDVQSSLVHSDHRLHLLSRFRLCHDLFHQHPEYGESYV